LNRMRHRRRWLLLLLLLLLLLGVRCLFGLFSPFRSLLRVSCRKPS